MRFSPETKKTNMKNKCTYASRYFSDYAPVLDACLPPLIQWKLCLMFAECTFNLLENITVFWHEQQNWTNFIRISI